eukprot:TRINITY_DN28844_c0_g2_i1.p1 TRINITY_DN28844_c0_g2~~TRINITY_DN28844_c0_g2_i1.p1  ORF type:complete len:551 (+),score=115.80 TRINITY_DN28844_c0_g2_i1:165-1655(+)
MARQHPCTSWRLVLIAVVVLASGELSVASAADVQLPGPSEWQQFGRETFVEYLMGVGCGQKCAPFIQANRPRPAWTLSSQVFGCADVDVLLPSLHWIYEDTRRRMGGELPGLLVDGGANVGRATARWMASLGDTFGRAAARNKSHASCIICSGADAADGQAKGAASRAAEAAPTVAIVAVEASRNNFELLQRHAVERGWEYEGYLGIHAALGNVSGEAFLAHNADFAIDELASIIIRAGDTRPRQRVRVVTLDEVVASAKEAIPGLPEAATLDIFLLKLDIEGMEPAVLRSIASSNVRVKFVTFEYAGNVWIEPLSGVVRDLSEIGYFCFIIAQERLFPVSYPFWDMAYELPIWSNLVCGLEEDDDLAALVQMHSGAVGLWPMLPRTFLEGYASEEEMKPRPLAEAQQLCADLGDACAGVTCDCPGGSGCGRGLLPPSALRASSSSGSGSSLGLCTARFGENGPHLSPTDEVTFLKDGELGELFLRYRRLRGKATK